MLNLVLLWCAVKRSFVSVAYRPHPNTHAAAGVGFRGEVTGMAFARFSTVRQAAYPCVVAALAVGAPHLLGCGAEVDLFECSPSPIHACPVAGCVDNAVVTLQGLPLDDASTLPIEVEVCREGDAACRYAEISAADAWEEPVPGRDCSFIEEANLLCCRYAPGSFHSCYPFHGTGTRLTLTLQEDLWDGAKHTVSVSARSAAGNTHLDGTATIVLDVYQPNGPGCAPTCYRGEAVIP